MVPYKKNKKNKKKKEKKKIGKILMRNKIIYKKKESLEKWPREKKKKKNE